jgi:acetate kinase
VWLLQVFSTLTLSVQLISAMVRTVLTVNSGSSSLKVSLLEQKLDDCLNPDRILTAVAERLGQDEAFLNIVFDIKYAKSTNSTGTHVSDCHSGHKIRNSIKQARMTHGQALVDILQVIRDLHYESDSTSLGLLDTIVAVGHRVVHGGQKFISSVIVDDEVINEIESLSHLAPL